MKVTPIYLISVYSRDFSRSRTWGYYHERELALQCVQENWTDICELGYYDYGLVCEMPIGPLSIANEEHWYEFYQNNGQWSARPTDRPTGAEGLVFGF